MEHGHLEHQSNHNPYKELARSLLASFVAMYFLMYSMADKLSEVFLNLNNVYMTGLMAGSMFPIMLITMPRMFPDKKTNITLWITSALILGASWFLLRTEGGVGDRQFLRAMIPHHSAAIQMCENSALSDPEIKELCKTIVSGQQNEIAQMKKRLSEL